jgi:hypothetical protein
MSESSGDTSGGVTSELLNSLTKNFIEVQSHVPFLRQDSESLSDYHSRMLATISASCTIASSAFIALHKGDQSLSQENKLDGALKFVGKRISELCSGIGAKRMRVLLIFFIMLLYYRKITH